MIDVDGFSPVLQESPDPERRELRWVGMHTDQVPEVEAGPEDPARGDTLDDADDWHDALEGLEERTSTSNRTRISASKRKNAVRRPEARLMFGWPQLQAALDNPESAGSSRAKQRWTTKPSQRKTLQIFQRRSR